MRRHRAPAESVAKAAGARFGVVVVGRILDYYWRRRRRRLNDAVGERRF